MDRPGEIIHVWCELHYSCLWSNYTWIYWVVFFFFSFYLPPSLNLSLYFSYYLWSATYFERCEDNKDSKVQGLNSEELLSSENIYWSCFFSVLFSKKRQQKQRFLLLTKIKWRESSYLIRTIWRGSSAVCPQTVQSMRWDALFMW